MNRPWIKNALFIALTVVGLAALTGTILVGDPRPKAGEYRPVREEDAQFQKVVAQVNAEFRDDWAKHKLTPAPRADDLTIARRLSLGLTGTIPSLEEIRAFEQRDAGERLEWWVSHLVSDRRFGDHVGERLTRAFVGVENGPFIAYRRRRFMLWLSDEVVKNRSYDQIVRQLITAEGIWTSRPETNFITATINQDNNTGPDEIKLAARVSRAFLGVRIDCVQCHDDNLGGDWKQEDFHELAAFFAKSEMTLTGVRDKGQPYKFKYLHAEDGFEARLKEFAAKNPDGPQAKQLAELDKLSPENRQKRILELAAVPVPPRVPFANELMPVRGEPRERLAAWATHPKNEAFARAAVNRVWAWMFGQPLVEPLDDIALDGPHPPGLQTLADDFVAHGYDLQRLVRVIAATDVYQLASTADHEITAKHEHHWAVFPLTRLRPEQVSGSILQAAKLKTVDADAQIFARLQFYDQQRQFVERYGDLGEDEFDDRGGTIPQRLLMLNGELVFERTKVDFMNNAATRISALAQDNAKAVEVAYLATLSRRPTAEETQHFSQRLGDAKGDYRHQIMEDVYWSLLNSTEFSWNH